MKKSSVFLGVTLMVVIVAGVFYACQKDVEPIVSKEIKSLGNYSQSTQNITIQTEIDFDGIVYPVTGQAIVGSHDGRIYECSVSWEIHSTGVGAAIAASEHAHFTAILKPEFYDIMIPVDPVSENYIITFSGGVTEKDISILWKRIVGICKENVAVDFRCPYILALSRETGINIFELAESPFFLEFVEQLNDFNAYFAGQIQNNIVSMEEFHALMQEFANAPLWEEDYIPQPGETKYIEYKEIYHDFYSLAEKLSQMYFGDNFNDEIVFDGVIYHVVAKEKINSLRNICDVFGAALINSYPQYLDLSEDMQDKVIRGALMMSCKETYLDALAAAAIKWDRSAKACEGLPEAEKEACLQRAAVVHYEEVQKAADDYTECLKGGK